MGSNVILRRGAFLERCYRIASNSHIQVRPSSSLTHLKDEMTARKLPLLYDNLTFNQSFLLSNTLSDFLPPYPEDARIPEPAKWADAAAQPLRPGYHLVQFPSASKLTALLPDNTESDQSPGEPFVRRMWAGGRIQFFPEKENRIRIGTGTTSVCMERISDVKIKGNEGDEKIFVTVDRRTSAHDRSTESEKPTFVDNSSAHQEDDIRKVLINDQHCGLIEERDIVFMRERTPEQAAAAAAKMSKVVKAPHPPDFSHVLTPTSSLLFRFSALTWNAHSIHLDKHFSREVEGHRNLLFHGPLSLVMMVELLQRHLASQGMMPVSGGSKLPSRTIKTIEYRNLAPLYAEEELRICGREKETNGDFELWIEGKDGGMCVRAQASTLDLRKDK